MNLIVFGHLAVARTLRDRMDDPYASLLKRREVPDTDGTTSGSCRVAVQEDSLGRNDYTRPSTTSVILQLSQWG